MFLLIFTLFIFLVNTIAVNPQQAIDSSLWENVHYYRNFDLSKVYVKEWSNVRAKNLADTPQDTYYFYLPDGFDVLPELSYISVSLTEMKQEIHPFKVADDLYLLKFPAPIAPQSSVDFAVKYTYANSVTPFPEKILLEDTQKLLLRLNKYPFSAYETNEYSLTFGGISKGQEMDLQLEDEVEITPNLPELKGRVEENYLTYGPVDGPIAPYAVQPMGLLYDHNKPMTTAIKLDRSIWLPGSDIDVLQTEEYYELTNRAAELKEGFSRVDWMKGRYEILRNHHGLSQLEFPINKKAPFDNYYITDKVGMVSTHQQKLGHLLFVPRYPLMGGWKYNFTLGWSNKLENFVHKVTGQPDTFIARVPLLNSLQNIHYDKVNLNMYLPEGAEFVEFSAPLLPESVVAGAEKSYLDVSSGHVKVTASFRNLYDDFAKLDAYVVYKYTAKAFWSKIGKIGGFVMAGMAAYYALNAIDLSTQ